MAFKTKWQCEYCGHTIWASSEPYESECPCYVESEPIIKKEVLSHDERSARYKEQYIINGYTWNGKPGEMYYKAFDDYPDRTYLKENR